MNNLNKYRGHLARFQAVPTQLCTPFFDTMLSSPDAYLECSCKISDTDIHPLRMNLWYRNHGSRLPIQEITALFEHYSLIGEFDFSLYHKLIGTEFCYEKAHFSVVGIDIRPEVQKSRLKVWHIIANYPEMEKVILGADGVPPEAALLKVHGGFLFGFDFGFGGSSALKVYPVLHDYEIQQQRCVLQDMFSEQFIALADRCRRVSLGFTTASGSVTGHMLPYDTAGFIGTLNSETLANAYASVGVSSAIVAMDVAEIDAGDCRNFNLYY